MATWEEKAREAAYAGNALALQEAIRHDRECVSRGEGELSGTLLHSAVSSHGGHNLECVRVLLEAGADVHKRDSSGDTPLIKACNYGNLVEVVKLLLKAHSDINAQNEYDQTALIETTGYGQADVMRVLLEAGAKKEIKDKSGATALIRAACVGSRNADCVELLINARADISVRDSLGRTPLIWAAESGNSDCVKLLLKAKADVNTKDNSGETALARAASTAYGDPHSVGFLLEAGAEPNTKDNTGVTPLMRAAIRGHDEQLKFLLEAGANPDLKDNKGRTALMWSAYGRTACTKLLLAANADISPKDDKGKSAMDYATKPRKYRECTQLLKEAEKGKRPSREETGLEIVSSRKVRKELRDKKAFTNTLISKKQKLIDAISSLKRATGIPNSETKPDSERKNHTGFYDIFTTDYESAQIIANSISQSIMNVFGTTEKHVSRRSEKNTHFHWHHDNVKITEDGQDYKITVELPHHLAEDRLAEKINEKVNDLIAPDKMSRDRGR